MNKCCACTIWMRVVAHINEGCCTYVTYESVLLCHVWISVVARAVAHVSYTNKYCCVTYEQVLRMACHMNKCCVWHTRISLVARVSHMLCHVWISVVSHTVAHLSHIITHPHPHPHSHSYSYTPILCRFAPPKMHAHNKTKQDSLSDDAFLKKSGVCIFAIEPDRSASGQCENRVL